MQMGVRLYHDGGEGVKIGFLSPLAASRRTSLTWLWEGFCWIRARLKLRHFRRQFDRFRRSVRPCRRHPRSHACGLPGVGG